ncbi:hypothetical protein BLA24_17205 [Streptomyces cinnamoneus]|uniref:Uncharacterized protein n=1 Tax=Streptomyces cinnamoneus TaxID=53446 RepID=A0A2G1XH34_STRCJ|nr:hypothetical protein [Streptomyces cinnamoneus]PHQ50554.1 hypothetical protein BLA24_17205 [Streptomyces cinnamoneus]PPT14192.1 hypothetical protein CYQ11_16070 [Streptomyces cinnamoneus]
MSFTSRIAPRRRTLVAAGTAVVLAVTLAACGSSKDSDSSMPGMDHGAHPSASSSSPSASASGMDHGHGSTSGMDHGGMDHAGMGDGLADTKDGYKLTSTATELPAGKDSAYSFQITGPDGKPVTAFAVDQTKRMHFYAVRADLTGFQHLHPSMTDDGTWTAALTALQPGTWRTYASFTPDDGPGKGKDFVLSRTVTVPGAAEKTPLPQATTSTEVDGYTVTVKGVLMAGMAHPATVSISKDGEPVTDLQPYLDTYAHLTAFHEGDQAFAHLHPETKVTGDHGGPDLSFQAMLPKPGNWRMFLQFQTGGKLHTAALTLSVS